MGVRVTRFAVVLLVLLTSVVAVSARMNEITDAGYLEVRSTPCWSCHVSWAPPLRELAVLVPPEGLEASRGADFDYTVRVQNGWIAEMVRFEPSVDISQAPSLAFADNPRPDIGNLTRGLIESAGIPTNAQRGHVIVDVPAGTSDLVLRLRPDNTDPLFGPDLTMNIYPGKDGPDGIPIVVNEGGPGQEEVFTIHGAELAEHGFGPWTVEAETRAVNTDGTIAPGSATDVGFTVASDRYYNATGGVQFLSKDLGFGNGLGPERGTVFTWQLRVVDTPGPDEHITVRLNLTSYYKHVDQSYEDIAYSAHEYVAPVVARQGGVAFEADTTTIVVDSEGATGVSWARISEVVGYISSFLVLASVYTGGMFGKKTRRQLNHVFQSAKRRVAFHNFLSYGIIVAALAHAVIFLWHWPNIEGNYHWTEGIIWGGIAILAMFALGVTGALQVPMIRKWNYAVWRWSHFWLTIAVIVFTIVHILLDSGNIGAVRNAIGWQNPLDPRTTA